jgi:nicotinamide-nucleotide adenylyltransferase
MKYKVGLVIGRFQPLHYGHIYLLQQALTHVEKIIIGIGSSNVTDEDNPFSYEQRVHMIRQAVQKENMMEDVVKIIPSDDVPDDDQWLKDTIELTGPIDTVIGNNNWVKGIFKKAGYPVVTIPYYKRELYEGKKIRTIMRKHDDWKTHTPLYLHEDIEAYMKSW